MNGFKYILLLISFILLLNESLISQVNITKQDTSGNLKEFMIQEQVIYAPKLPGSVLQTPSSITLIEAAEIERSQITSLKDFTAQVPNLYMPDYGSKLTSPIYIRGIGSRINSPSIGLNVDNAPYFEKASFDFSLYDIERIEVLRGPQGTLYGRNTMGGLINVYTRSPLSIQGTELFYSQGSFGLTNLGLGHYGKLNDQFGYTLNVNYLAEEGYFENKFNNQKVDNLKTFAGRLRTLYLANKLTFENIFSLDISDQGGYPYSIFIDSTKTTLPINYNQRSYYKRNIFTDAFIIKYNQDKFNLMSISSFQYLKDDQGIDQDFTDKTLYYITQKQKHLMFSQELIARSPEKSNYEWLFGAFGFYQNFDNKVYASLYTQKTDYEKDYLHKIYGFALFHQSSLNNLLIENLSLTLGIRWDVEVDEMKFYYDRTVNNVYSVVDDTLYPSLKTSEILPKVALQYNINKLSTIYATVAKGYKTGGYNTTFERPEDLTFGSERSWNYEAGIKTTLLDNIIYTDLSLFYIDWKNQQIYQTVPSGKGSMLKNAGVSVSKGAEFTLQVTPNENLQTYLAAGYTDARFVEYIQDQKVNFNNMYIPYVPKYTMGIGVVKTFDLQHNYYQYLRFSVRYNLFGDHYWKENNIAKQDAYGLLDITVSFLASHFSFDIWAKNVLNQEYNSFYFTALGNSYVQKGKPFRYGVKISVRF